MVGHGGSSAGSYLADPSSPIPSHCASIVVTSTVRVNTAGFVCKPFNCQDMMLYHQLTLTLPGPSAGVSGSLDSYCSLKPLCSGMGEAVPARTSPTLLPPSPRTVLSLSCFKVLQCINCCD